MTKTLSALVFSSLVALGMAACGGGGGNDTVNQVCDKLKSCGVLQDADVASCKSQGNTQVKSMSADQISAVDACLAKQCTEFLSCVTPYMGN